jgi:hypothetical protein
MNTPANGILRDFALTVDGEGYAGNAEEVTLPALDLLIVDYKAGGLDAPLSIDMGMEKMQLKAKLNDTTADALATFGLLGSQDKTVTLKGAAQNLDNSISQIAVSARGKCRTLTASPWKKGETANHEYVWDLSYYQYAVDGSVVHQIDVQNGIRIINGVDQLQNVRAALGL